ncbi:MAG: 2-amino-4-hydroxy-6-hydroxymethyldihydropteridine diphosphokinase [Alphaproteobacteria bacterium]|nr:2-amino-4-hydroxy-6-hydroxymethyldihydropteridine diphosphokinase [Alphaproteobacteria bacterium]
MTTVYLSLGSNLGDKRAYLRAAVDALKLILRDVKESSVYETAPLYVTDQLAFLNQAISGKTDLEPLAFLRQCQAIQKAVGRTAQAVRFGPREIDIDIISFGDILLKTETIEIPHPRLHERLFVLEPLAEIAPDWACPKTGHSVQELIQKI